MTDTLIGNPIDVSLFLYTDFTLNGNDNDFSSYDGHSNTFRQTDS